MNILFFLNIGYPISQRSISLGFLLGSPSIKYIEHWRKLGIYRQQELTSFNVSPNSTVFDNVDYKMHIKLAKTIDSMFLMSCHLIQKYYTISGRLCFLLQRGSDSLSHALKVKKPSKTNND